MQQRVVVKENLSNGKDKFIYYHVENVLAVTEGENDIVSEFSGIVKRVLVNVDDVISTDQPLVEFA